MIRKLIQKGSSQANQPSDGSGPTWLWKDSDGRGRPALPEQRPLCFPEPSLESLLGCSLLRPLLAAERSAPPPAPELFATSGETGTPGHLKTGDRSVCKKTFLNSAFLPPPHLETQGEAFGTCPEASALPVPCHLSRESQLPIDGPASKFSLLSLTHQQTPFPATGPTPPGATPICHPESNLNRPLLLQTPLCSLISPGVPSTVTIQPNPYCSPGRGEP